MEKNKRFIFKRTKFEKLAINVAFIVFSLDYSRHSRESG